MSEHFMQSIARENTERRVSYWGRKLRKAANEGHPPSSIALVAKRFVAEVEKLDRQRRNL
jgi:hypothetical protein